MHCASIQFDRAGFKLFAFEFDPIQSSTILGPGLMNKILQVGIYLCPIDDFIGQDFVNQRLSWAL